MSTPTLYQYAKDKGGQALEKDYKYQGTDGTCNTNVARQSINIVTAQPNWNINYDEQKMMDLLKTGPVVIYMSAGDKFSNFKSGDILTFSQA
jgi:KDEL-tailed cysteine endopeptidase